MELQPSQGMNQPAPSSTIKYSVHTCEQGSAQSRILFQYMTMTSQCYLACEKIVIGLWFILWGRDCCHNMHDNPDIQVGPANKQLISSKISQVIPSIKLVLPSQKPVVMASVDLHSLPSFVNGACNFSRWFLQNHRGWKTQTWQGNWREM